MYRARLRSKTGCLNCKRRRKKCDEAKPACGRCLRLRLLCDGMNEVPPTPASSSLPEIEPESSFDNGKSAYETSGTALSVQRIADHDGLDRHAAGSPSGIARELRACWEGRPEDVDLVTEAGELRHIFIRGIYEGWDQVSGRLYPREMWSRLIQLDTALKMGGHGKVARLAIGILSLAMAQYLADPGIGPDQLVMSLPVWYIPTHGTKPVNSMMWPAVRDRLANAPPRLSGDRFTWILISEGMRFIWPFQPHAAITRSEATSRFSITDEFFLRINSIRSFAMPAHFLDNYPEFRGEAPQLEPSPTFYTPQDKDHLETFYWKLLRDRAWRAKAGNHTPYREQFTFLSDSTDRTAGTVRSQPTLAIRNLLNWNDNNAGS